MSRKEIFSYTTAAIMAALTIYGAYLDHGVWILVFGALFVAGLMVWLRILERNRI